MIGGREAEDNWKKCHFSPSLPDATGRRQKFFFFLRRKEDYSLVALTLCFYFPKRNSKVSS